MKSSFGLFPSQQKPELTELSFVGRKELITDIEQANMKDISNQSTEAIVTTPIKSGNTQSTQPHA